MMRVAAMAIAAMASASSGQVAAPSMAAGREAARQLLAGDAAALAPRLSPALLGALGGPTGVPRFLASVREQLGTEEQVLSETAFQEGDLLSYYRRSRFGKLADVTMFFAIDRAGVVQGASVQPTAPAPASPNEAYATKAAFRLPFGTPAAGRWYVSWGGRDAVHNYHVVAKDQRFANDLIVVDDRSSPYRTDGKANADHLCWGQPIVAPAAGTVVTATDGIVDNVPGVVNVAVPPGNHVVIDHGGNEYSLLAHLRQGSVRVKPGQSVKAGAALGQCGNSGRSTMPHLHFHLQDAAGFGNGDGLPIRFRTLRADGKAVASGELLRGQRLEP